MDEEFDREIYLVPESDSPASAGADRPGQAAPRSRRFRVLLAAGVLAVLAAAVGIQHVHAARAGSLAVGRPAASGSPATTAWPQGAGVCGASVELPQTTSDPLSQPTHTQVLVTGMPPALVEVDSGQRRAIPGLQLTSEQYVSAAVRVGAVTYALLRSCPQRELGTVVRAQAGAAQRRVSGGWTVFGLLSGGDGSVWAEAYTGPLGLSPESAVGTTLVRLDRAAPAVPLPADLNVIGISGSEVVAATAGSDGAPLRDRLYRYDLGTRTQSLLGISYGATLSGSVVLWTSSPCSAVAACPVSSFDLRTGDYSVRDYHLPLGSTLTGGVLSPDRRKLAFLLQRESPDPRYRSDSNADPADLVVLDLRTGIVDPVPGIELPPGRLPSSLAFSSDSTWLLVGLAEDGRTGVYAWRSGLSRPQRSPTVLS